MRDVDELLTSKTPPWYGNPKYAVGVLAAIAAALVVFLMTVVVNAQTASTEKLDAQSLVLQRLLIVSEQICLNTAAGEPAAIARCQAVSR